MSELKFWIRLPLFLSSFLPLWITLLLFLIFKVNGSLENLDPIESAIACFLTLTCIIPTIVVILLIHKMRNSGTEKKTITVKRHSNLTKEFLLYLVTYTIPFVLHDTFDHFDFMAIMIFMCAVGSIYLKSDMIFINPLFAFMNYKLHSVYDKNNVKYYILTKNDVFNNEEIKTVRIDRYFYIEQK